MNLTFPWPPTGNTAVRHARGAHYVTDRVRSYHHVVAATIAPCRLAQPLSRPIRVVAELAPPDRRRRDMDNAWKTLADALTHAGLWHDDHLIADLRLIRSAPVPGGRVSLLVEEMS